MKTTHSAAAFARPPKDSLMRFRCSESLRVRVLRMAAMKEKDYSDLLREAAVDLVTKFEQTVKVA